MNAGRKNRNTSRKLWKSTCELKIGIPSNVAVEHGKGQDHLSFGGSMLIVNSHGGRGMLSGLRGRITRGEKKAWVERDQGPRASFRLPGMTSNTEGKRINVKRKEAAFKIQQPLQTGGPR